MGSGVGQCRTPAQPLQQLLCACPAPSETPGRSSPAVPRSGSDTHSGPGHGPAPAPPWRPSAFLTKTQKPRRSSRSAAVSIHSPVRLSSVVSMLILLQRLGRACWAPCAWWGDHRGAPGVPGTGQRPGAPGEHLCPRDPQPSLARALPARRRSSSTRPERLPCPGICPGISPGSTEGAQLGAATSALRTPGTVPPHPPLLGSGQPGQCQHCPAVPPIPREPCGPKPSHPRGERQKETPVPIWLQPPARPSRGHPLGTTVAGWAPEPQPPRGSQGALGPQLQPR